MAALSAIMINAVHCQLYWVYNIVMLIEDMAYGELHLGFEVSRCCIQLGFEVSRCCIQLGFEVSICCIAVGV